MKQKTGLSMSCQQHFRIQKHIPLLFLLSTIFFISISILFANSVSSSETLLVKVGFYENHPKIFSDKSGKISGFWPDLIEYIAKKEKWRIEYVRGTWSEGLSRLKKREIDIMPDVAFTEERNKLYTFSSDPVLLSWTRLYVNRKNKKINSIQDLENKKIAALKGSINLDGSGGLKEIVHGFNIQCTLIEMDNYTEVFKAIAENRVDAGITNRNFGNKNSKNFAVRKTPVIFQPINMKFAFPDDARLTSVFVEKINHHMAQLIADDDSLYYHLLKKYFEAEIAEKRIKVFPGWFKIALQSVSALFVFFILVIVISQFQARRKTSELKSINNALMHSEERFRSLTDDVLDNSLVGIFILDSDFRVVWVNQSIEEYFGLKRNEIIGKDKRQLIREKIEDIFENPDEFENKVFSTYDDNTYVERFECHILPDGEREERWLEHRSQPIQSGLYNGGRIEHYYDITDIKQAQKALLESELKFREMTNLLPQVVFESDIQGNLTFLNEQAYNLFGYSQEDVDNGLDFLHSLVPEDRARAKENVNNIVNGKPFKNVEYTAIKKDGLTSPIMTYTSPIIKDRKITGLRGIIVDISEQKKMEEELLKVRKLESVAVLAGGIAHDFNNILAAILGNISLALMTADPKGEIHELLLESEKASLRAKDLTQQLLTFAKGGEPVKKIAVIDEIIKDSAEFVLRGSNVRCDFNFGDELWSVAVDTGQISQVIQNIIVNASQAMPSGGTIVIDCLNYCLESNDIIPVSPGNYIKIVAKDQGVGIPTDMLDKIFDPYFTTKQKGSGLGLAITHSIISKHNGHITVDSELGQGTTFTVYLPASQERPEFEQKAVVVPPVAGRGRIMVMDDEEMIISLIEKTFSRNGYEVISAASGDEAVKLYQKAKETGAPIDLIIMDLTIPGGMGGKEAIKEIHKIDPEAKVIVSSGYSNDPVMADFGEYGFCAAIVKPFHIKEMMDFVGKTISG